MFDNAGLDTDSVHVRRNQGNDTLLFHMQSFCLPVARLFAVHIDVFLQKRLPACTIGKTDRKYGLRYID